MTKFLGMLLSLWALCAVAEDATPVNPLLGEQLLSVPVPSSGIIQTNAHLVTTIFMPPGKGPFPVVVMNHGKSPGNPALQPRSRPVYIALEFLRRGYVVVAPNRRGFSGSDGMQRSHCGDTYHDGLQNAEDIKAVLDWVVQQPWADKTRMLVMGQSHGGLATIAFDSMGYPGVRGVVNFAGILRNQACDWHRAMQSAVEEYGKTSRLPSLWFYAANDSYTTPEWAHRYWDAFQQAGGVGRLIAYGSFSDDGHKMSSSLGGPAIWLPEVLPFLHQLGMPTTIVNTIPEWAAYSTIAPPAPSHFAALEQVQALPNAGDQERQTYQTFLEKAQPRAFAASPNGSWGWANEGNNPLSRALANCEKHNRRPGTCRLYAVNDDVVW